MAKRKKIEVKIPKIKSRPEDIGEIQIKEFIQKAPLGAKKPSVTVKIRKRKPLKWLELAKEKPKLKGFDLEDSFMASELVELGKVSRRRIRAAKTIPECVAAGGIVKRAPAWSTKDFICALPPRRTIRRSRLGLLDGLDGLDGLEMEGRRRIRRRLGLLDGLAMEGRRRIRRRRLGLLDGLGDFGDVSVKVIKEKGASIFMPTRLNIAAVLFGQIVGSGIASATDKILAKASPTTYSKIGAYLPYIFGGVSTGLHIFVKSSFTFGTMLGTLPLVVDALSTQLANMIAPKKVEEQKPTLPPPPSTSPQSPTASGIGQLSPMELEQVRRLRERLRLSGGSSEGSEVAPTTKGIGFGVRTTWN